MTTQLDPPDAAVSALAGIATGAVLGPRDPGYEEGCAAWNLAWTHRPAAVVRAADENDVVLAVAHARRQGLTVAVQATGHGVTVPADERSLLIVVSGIDHVTVDAGARTATIGGGVTWNPVLAAAADHGLAPLLGSAPHVGAVGYALGGGFGWLARQYGLAVDSIRSLRVVLPDASVVTASPSEHPDLFWALCGAGAGSLGVVTEMTVGLAPVGEVYAGNLLYPLELAVEVFDRYVEWSARAPEQLTSAFNITAFPSLDIVPEPLRGQTFVIVRGCYAGDDLDDGARLIDEWRKWREPLIDMFGPMPFTRVAEISQDPVDPVPAASSGRWLRTLDHTVLEAMLETVAGGSGPSPMLFAEARQAGGAIAVPNPAVSFTARDAAFSLETVGLITGPEADAEIDARNAAAWQRLAGHLAALPGYLNFNEGEERRAVASSAFGADVWQRLTAVKRRTDPRNRFAHGLDFSR